MPINLKCKCGAVLTLDVEHIGKVAKCGQCGKQFRVPESLRSKMEAAAESPSKTQPKTAAPTPEPEPKLEPEPALAPEPKPEPRVELEDDSAGLALADDDAPVAEEMECPNCGKTLPSESVICIGCGHNFQTGASATEVQTESIMTPADARMAAAMHDSEQQQDETAAEEGRSSIAAYQKGQMGALMDKVGGPKVAIAIVAVLVLGIGAFVAFKFMGKSDSDGSGTSTAQRQPQPGPGTAPEPDNGEPGSDGGQEQPKPEPKKEPPAPTFKGFVGAASKATVRLRALYAGLTAHVKAKGEWPASLNDLVPESIKAADVAGLVGAEEGAEAVPELAQHYVYVGPEIAALPRHRMLVHERTGSGPDGAVMALFSDGDVRALAKSEVADYALRKAQGAYLTRAEAALLNALRPRISVRNRRFKSLAVLVDGKKSGDVPFGEAVEVALSPGKHNIAFAALGKTTDALELSVNNATVYRLEARPHRELPAVYLQACRYYMKQKAYRRGKAPFGPEYEAVFAAGGTDDAPRVLMLKSEQETVRALLSTQTGGDGGPASISVDLDKGLLDGTILRGEIEYSGLDGRPIKVSPYQRLAEGRARFPNGEVVTYYDTNIGTFVRSEKASLVLASLLGFGLPEDEAVLPRGGQVDIDALMPLLRKAGRPAVRELLRALAAGPQAQTAKAEPEAAEKKEPTLPAIAGRQEGRHGGGGDQGAFLGPWTRGNQRGEDRYMREPREPNEMTPEEKPKAVGAARVPTTYERTIATLGFYLRPAEIGMLTAVISKATDIHQRRAAALALGRIGSPLAIDDITNRKEWEGGPAPESLPTPTQAAPVASGEPGMEEPPQDYDYSGGPERGTRITVSKEDVLAPLAMIDADAMPAGAEAKDAPPGRRAVCLLVRGSDARMLENVVTKWPKGAGELAAQNYVRGLALSYSKVLADSALLDACYRIAPVATADLCRTYVKTEQNKLPFYRVLCRSLDSASVGTLAGMKGNAIQAATAAEALAETLDAGLIPQVKACVDVVLASGTPAQKVAVLGAWARLNLAAGEDLEAAAAVLQTQLAAEPVEVRLAAVKGLDILSARAGVGVLQPAIEAAKPEVQKAAVIALRTHKAQDVLPLLKAALKSSDTGVLAETASLALTMNATPLKDDLTALFGKHVANEQAGDFVKSAAAALAKFGGKGAVMTLRPGLFHPLPDVRASLARTLGTLKTQEVAPDLYRLLSDDSTAVRVAAVEALGGSGLPRAYRELAQIAFPTEGGYTDASWPALKALVQSNDPQAYEALRGVLGLQDMMKFWSVIYAAYTQLPQGKRDTCVRFLCSYLTADNKQLRVLVAHGLAELGAGESARAAFLSLPRELDTTDILASMARVLGKAGHEEDLAVLDRYLRSYAREHTARPRRDRDEGRYDRPGGEQQASPVVTIIEAFGAIGGKQAAGCIGRYILKAQNDEEIAAMISALGEIETAEAVQVLASLYRRVESEELKMSAIEAMGKIGHTNAKWAERTVFEDALRETNPEVLATVGDALDTMARNGGDVAEPEA